MRCAEEIKQIRRQLIYIYKLGYNARNSKANPTNKQQKCWNFLPLQYLLPFYLLSTSVDFRFKNRF